MAKEVIVKATIRKDGTVKLTIDGTQGDECLDVLSVIEKIAGFSTIETRRVGDTDTRDVQIVGEQKLRG